MNITEVVREFLLESHENLDQLDRSFVELEKNPQDHENIAGIFRTIHTIKGTAGFLGFPNLERVAHAGETVLSMLRDGTLALDREITSALLHVVDVTRSNLDEIESSGAESSETHPELIAELMAIARGTAAPAAAKPPAPAPLVIATPSVPVAVAVPVPVAVSIGLPPAIHVDDEGRETAIERREAERRGGDDRRHGITDSSMRVDVGLLDKLMNLVGELVLARNQILQFSATQEDAGFLGTVAAAQPDHHRAAGRRHEDAHAADRQRLEQVPARRARPGASPAASRCASRWRARRPSSTRRSSRRSGTR